MTKVLISEETKNVLQKFLSENRHAELINTYLLFVENRFGLEPVLYPKDKMIYQSTAEAVKLLERESKLWHETEIKVGYSHQAVNEQTTKIYICPFTGKVFGNNTHPNPQDAIYDWVSKCPENTERVNGLRVKRFFVSEDADVIKGYLDKSKPKEPVTKVVFSSVLSGKLFSSKEAVIQDFKKNYLKRLSLIELQSQNKYQIEERFLAFIQEQLVEDKIAAFVEALAEFDEFQPFVEMWVE